MFLVFEWSVFGYPLFLDPHEVQRRILIFRVERPWTSPWPSTSRPPTVTLEIPDHFILWTIPDKTSTQLLSGKLSKTLLQVKKEFKNRIKSIYENGNLNFRNTVTIWIPDMSGIWMVPTSLVAFPKNYLITRLVKWNGDLKLDQMQFSILTQNK